MKITVDSLAWLSMDSLSGAQLEWLRRRLTIADVTGGREAVLVRAYEERDGQIGIPRGFLYEEMVKGHELVENVSSGLPWPKQVRAPVDALWRDQQDSDRYQLTLTDAESGSGAAVFAVPDQRRGFAAVLEYLSPRQSGGGLLTMSSWTDGVRVCLALIRSLRVRALVVCPRKADVPPWKGLAARHLPDAKVGRGKNAHITVMCAKTLSDLLSSGKLAGGEYGLVISDRLDCMDPCEWASLMSRMTAGRLLGVSSEVINMKGKNRLFSYYLGRPLFAGKGAQLVPKVRRVWSKWRNATAGYANPQYMSRGAAVDMMCASGTYRQHVVEQILLALNAGRKVLVFSDKSTHLGDLRHEVKEQFCGRELVMDVVAVGMSEKSMERASGADVLFAKYDSLKQLPDTSAMDTVVLATPVQAPGDYVDRILEPMDGKKDPIVVDMRCDSIPACKKLGYLRDGFYKRYYGEGR